MTTFGGEICCPSCRSQDVVHYVLAWKCNTCGDHGSKQKRKRTQADAERRDEWRRFSFTEQYAAFQIDAMKRHLRATPAVDTVQVSAHDAFGNPEESWTTITAQWL